MNALLAALLVAHTSTVWVGAAQVKKGTPAVALRGGLPDVPVALARLDPGWWKASTPTTTAAPSQAKKEDAKTTDSKTTDAKTTAKSIFDVEVETCTPFLSMPGTFVANAEYFADECKAVPTDATYVKMTVGTVVDYFKPKASKSVCDMLASPDQHQWSSDGKKWATPDAGTVGLGGSADNWLTKQKTSDKRDTPSFWGIKAPNSQTGGCCHKDNKAETKAWALPYQMSYCGMPQALAPVCTPLTTVAGSFSADKDYWATICRKIPQSATFVKLFMGGSVDYFQPPIGDSFCDMLTANNKHKWSKDGETWVTPKYDTVATTLGGSADKGLETGDPRTKVSFWGSNLKNNDNLGGCCYASPGDKLPSYGKTFTMSYCEVAIAPPVSQLVELLHQTEDAVTALETEMHGLHSYLAKAENTNLAAAGNVSLARSGMFKLAVKAKDEADELNSFTMRSSLLGSTMDVSDTQLMGATKQVRSSQKLASESAALAKKLASQPALKAADDLNSNIWKLMDPSNKDNLDATEGAVRALEKRSDGFRAKIKGEIKRVMVSRMRRSTNRLRKVIHRLGTVGAKVSDGGLGEVESSEPLGADLGLDED